MPSPDETPPSVREALTALARDTRRLTVSLSPWDAWVTVAVIQYATRNPNLNAIQRNQAVRIGRALQDALVRIAPGVGGLLEAGWDPNQDVPRAEEEP